MNKISYYKDWLAIPLLFWICLCHSPVFARSTSRHYIQQQSEPIQGTITDTNGVLPFVTISIKGKAHSSLTDAVGKYTINALPTDVLVFSFVGYKTMERTVGENRTMNVQMQEDATTLQEVRVNAGYYSVKESERTGSIAKISVKDIEKQPVTNVLATMQGRMAGVNITQTTGVPGGGFDIQIRGQNSLRADGNQPMYIIDGVPYASDAIGSFYTRVPHHGKPVPLTALIPATLKASRCLKMPMPQLFMAPAVPMAWYSSRPKEVRKAKRVLPPMSRTVLGRLLVFWT